MIIYKTINLITREYYIGKDGKNNPDYLGSGLILKRAIKKYGRENFVKEILEVCSNEKELNLAEIRWVDEKVVEDPNSYNLVLGGQGGNLLTHEQKIKRGTCEKIAKAHNGKNLSSDHKRKISDGMNSYKSEKKFKNSNKSHFGESNPFFGKKHQGDLSRFGKHRKNVPPTNAKKVRCIETGEIFSSATKASEKFPNPNTARRAISEVCQNRRKHFFNLTFEYI